jgi:hypothetical protein
VRRAWAGGVALFLLSLALRLAFLHGVDPRETLRADGWHYTMLALRDLIARAPRRSRS